MGANQAAPTDSPASVEGGILAKMWLIRAFEEKAASLYAKGRIRGLLHLGIGQEATAVGVCNELDLGDKVVGSHRPHAHLLAKGGDPVRLMAELAGRSIGYCGGKGGSMHVVAKEVGFLTATGVVGGNIPLALGAALAGRERGEVASVFFGDGASQSGAFHESLNMASLWKLPVVFVCENNGYAEFTPLSAHTNVQRLAEHARTYAIPAETVDGNDVEAVRDTAQAAVERARSGGGPSFLECLTYRLRGHYEGDQSKYRELSELVEWKEKDPIARYERQLESRGVISDQQVEAIRHGARDTIESATATALAGESDVLSITTDVYAAS